MEVPWSETVRGYEYAKGQYVMLTDEDFEKLPLPSKHTIELSAFVKAEEIDPVFYERSYYLAPDERGEKAYALLHARPWRRRVSPPSPRSRSGRRSSSARSGPGTAC